MPSTQPSRETRRQSYQLTTLNSNQIVSGLTWTSTTWSFRQENKSTQLWRPSCPRTQSSQLFISRRCPEDSKRKLVKPPALTRILSVTTLKSQARELIRTRRNLHQRFKTPFELGKSRSSLPLVKPLTRGSMLKPKTSYSMWNHFGHSNRTWESSLSEMEC